MIITSVDFDGVWIGFDWAAEPKKERRVAVFPTGVAFSCFGLWERGMKWGEEVAAATESGAEDNGTGGVLG